MTSDQLIKLVAAAGPYVVAFAGTLFGFLGQRLGVTAERERWKEQHKADAGKLDADHRRQLELREAESREGQEHEHADRLRTEAAQFITLFAEARTALFTVASNLEYHAEKDEWDQLAVSLEPWTARLSAKLSTAAAMMKIIGGSEVSAAANKAQLAIENEIFMLTSSYEQHSSRQSLSLSSWYGQDEMDDFATAVATELRTSRTQETEAPD